MNSGQEISSELVISGCNSPEILQAAEAALDDVSSLIGFLVEAMEDDAVGFVGNDGLCAPTGNFGTQFVAVIPLVSNEGAHGWCQGENIGGGGNVCVLAGG